jgi:ABC-type transporter Mla MlaB component
VAASSRRLGAEVSYNRHIVGPGVTNGAATIDDMVESTVVVTEPLTRPVLDKWAGVLGAVADRRPARLVLDLSRAETVDADGILLLLQLHRRLIAADGRLIIRSPTVRVRRLFHLARVAGVLAVDTDAPSEVV